MTILLLLEGMGGGGGEAPGAPDGGGGDVVVISNVGGIGGVLRGQRAGFLAETREYRDAEDELVLECLI